jgi:hypothetical protein
MALVAHDVMPARAPVGGAVRHPGEVAGLLLWCAVVGVALVWGTLAVSTRDVGLHAAPFKGHWTWHGDWRLLPAAGLGAAVAWWGPRAAGRLRWRGVPVAAGAAAAVWTALLAAGDGVAAITAPLTTRFEYEPFAAGVGDLGGLLSTYVDRLGGYPIHVQGHPPGPVALAWVLDRVGLGGAGWLATVAVAAWGVTVAAALVTARVVAGEPIARRAAPVLVLLPAAVWAGTSVDPVFAALCAVAIALAAHAVAAGGAEPGTGRRGSPAGAAVAGGLVFGAALLFSYGTVLLALVLAAAMVGASVSRGTWPPIGALVLVGLGVLVVLTLAARAGFWWPAGFEATRAAYWDGIGSRRPGAYLTVVGNPAVLAVALGPLVAVGLGALAHHSARAVREARARATVATLRSAAAGDPRLTLAGLVGAALVAVALADLSQLARGEVERIWLPFVPWLALAAPGERRGWLAAQAGVALVLQASLDSPW